MDASSGGVQPTTSVRSAARSAAAAGAPASGAWNDTSRADAGGRGCAARLALAKSRKKTRTRRSWPSSTAQDRCVYSSPRNNTAAPGSEKQDELLVENEPRRLGPRRRDVDDDGKRRAVLVVAELRVRRCRIQRRVRLEAHEALARDARRRSLYAREQRPQRRQVAAERDRRLGIGVVEEVGALPVRVEAELPRQVSPPDPGVEVAAHQGRQDAVAALPELAAVAPRLAGAEGADRGRGRPCDGRVGAQSFRRPLFIAGRAQRARAWRCYLSNRARRRHAPPPRALAGTQPRPRAAVSRLARH